jgi:hypothetical protein
MADKYTNEANDMIVSNNNSHGKIEQLEGINSRMNITLNELKIEN